MPDPTLRSIKEEIRRSIIYYAVDAFDKFGSSSKFKEFIKSSVIYPDLLYKNYLMNEKISFSIISERELESMVGRVALTEILKGDWDGAYVFNSVKDLVIGSYVDQGFSDLAKRANAQVDAVYVLSGLTKYAIVNDESDAKIRLSKRVHQITSNLKNQNSQNQLEVNNNSFKLSLSWIIAISILAISIVGILSIFIDDDSRSAAEQGLDNYCSSQGRSGCSDTARELQRIGNQ